MEQDIFFESLRRERNQRLSESDKLLIPFSLDSFKDDSQYEVFKQIYEEYTIPMREYRQQLRDLPSQPGAPWDGGGELTPWPVRPRSFFDN